MVLYNIFYGVSIFLQIIYYFLLIYCLMSWFLPPYSKVMMFLARFVDPFLRPIRNVLFGIFPRLRIDFSALIMFFVLRAAQSLLWQLYALIAFR